jgi:hypothetical protein
MNEARFRLPGRRNSLLLNGAQNARNVIFSSSTESMGQMKGSGAYDVSLRDKRGRELADLRADPTCIRGRLNYFCFGVVAVSP